MNSGRGGMGSHKHGVSGTNGQNRRGLQSLAREVNSQFTRKKKSIEPMFKSIQDLMRNVRKNRKGL